MKNTKLDSIEQFRTDFVRQLGDYKRKNGLLNEDLAKKIGCNCSYISILTSRSRPLSVETMVRVLGKLGLDVHMKIVNPKCGRKKQIQA